MKLALLPTMNKKYYEGGKIIVNDSFRYNNTAKRYLEEMGELKATVIEMLLKNESRIDEKLNLGEFQYDRVLKSVIRMDSTVSNPIELKLRNLDYSTMELERWARESASNIFKLKMNEGGYVPDSFSTDDFEDANLWIVYKKGGVIDNSLAEKAANYLNNWKNDEIKFKVERLTSEQKKAEGLPSRINWHMMVNGESVSWMNDNSIIDEAEKFGFQH